MPIATVSTWQGAVDGLLAFVDTVGQQAEIKTRRIAPPTANSFEQRLIFDSFLVVPKMAFVTANGKTAFDKVGTEVTIDSFGYMYFTPNITSEMYIFFQGSIYEIISVEDIGNINGIIKLTLKFNGSDTKKGAEI